MQLDDSARQELALWVALCNIHGLGNQGVCQLLKAFGEPKSVFDAPYSQLRQIVADKIAETISAGPDVSSTESTLDWLASEQNHLITLADTDYPKALLEIPDPPPLLYAKGQKKWLNTPGIAVVGSRNASPQGEKNAEDFSQALANHGYTIISGMALGIDGAAHRGALKATGATIAVVGTGLDIVYPSRHRELAHQIAEQGLILSEFPLGTPSKAQNFPRRNRIISGLATGCLVVEANVQSGSLITARLAAEQGREVFAIPGSIHSPVSKGCHQLIKQGAKLVDNIQDIVDELGTITRKNIFTELQTLPEANPLLDSMGFEPVTMEVLLERSGLTSDNLSAMLLMLELESRVASLPGGRYQRLT
ncbi:MAG: DNA-protecting protein DprA [Betaproteobacteria bacterium HGW-Betaproteobacteria-1]|jgi:DNA processing protein|nr:MAG: DNA-protecting protein DprA [Betaproteobacteria bacterium HGW-Betaproteobacteria-1]